jgi:hypothetical protein
MRQKYPRLSKMARDLFLIPAMSNEPERTFSAAGDTVVPQRKRLSADAISEAQCIRSWMKQGIITNLQGTFERVIATPITIE